MSSISSLTPSSIVINQNHSQTSTEPQAALIPYYGDPSLSKISNVMLRAIHGNSCLKDAQVICIGDYHSDRLQKFIRAKMINEIISAKSTRDKIYFLLEGVEGDPTDSHQVKSSQEAFDEAYECLVGKGLIRHPHTIMGWDNEVFFCFSQELIRRIQVERRTLELLNRIRALNVSESTQDAIKIVLNKINELADGVINVAKVRNLSLYQSVKDLHQKDPQSTIIVIAGRRHFESISQQINDICHCVLEIKTVPSQLTGFKFLNSLYGETDVSEPVTSSSNT